MRGQGLPNRKATRRSIAAARSAPKDAPSLSVSVASSVDAPVRLIPVFAELFAGLEALGSRPGEIVRALRQAGIERASRVIDMGCGKGAVALAAATKLGCRVQGIDACRAFIDEARRTARARELTGLCRFRCADLRSLRSGRYDAALMIGVLPFAQAIHVLRPLVRRGGVYLIEDCWWDERIAPAPRAAWTRERAAGVIGSLGDELTAVRTSTPSTVRRLNGALYRRLEINARRLMRLHVGLRADLRVFLARQREANRLLESALRPAIWTVRRSGLLDSTRPLKGSDSA